MCDENANTKEHVPPLCLFPEEKDLPKGVMLRNQLIKVPSCENHNIAKSGDDEYLLYILCMNIANNSVAFRQFATKVRRANKYRPGLMSTITRKNYIVIAVNSIGSAFDTLMAKIDMERITKCLNHISRALYYYKFNKTFVGECRFLYDWTIRNKSNFKIKVNDEQKELVAIEHVKAYFN